MTWTPTEAVRDRTTPATRSQPPESQHQGQTARFIWSVTLKRVTCILIAATTALTLLGCGSTPRARAATSTAFGTAGGAAIGSLSGHAWQGAMIGAGVGGLAGVLWDEFRNGSFDTPAPKTPAYPEPPPPE